MNVEPHCTVLMSIWAVASIITFLYLDIPASLPICIMTAIGLPPVGALVMALMMAAAQQQYQSMFNFVNGDASLFDVMIVCAMFDD